MEKHAYNLDKLIRITAKTNQEILKLTVEKGIESVKADPDMRPYEVEGSVAGFEACRGINVDSPDEMLELLEKTSKEVEEKFHNHLEYQMGLPDYWRIRYKQIQIEYVFEIMKCAWVESGHDFPSVSAGAYLKFKSIQN